MSLFSQEHRLLSISDFGLGKDTFLLTSFEGSEHISDLFQFEIEVLSENMDISPDDIVGKTATVCIQNTTERYFHGYISHFTFGEPQGHSLRQYKLIMVPWLWFLSKTNNHRIFQQKNTKAIVTQIFSDLGFSDFKFQADGGATREYCIQHNESDVQFISRLLEEEGICYYFLHEKNQHTLYLVDQQNVYKNCSESDVEYSKGSKPGNYILQWEHVYSFRKGQWTINDYDFKTPDRKLVTTTPALKNYVGANQLEHYEYPGLYQSDLGDPLVKIRMDAEEASKDIIKGESNCCTFYAGGKFKVDKHNTKSELGGYVLIGIHHKAYDRSYMQENRQGKKGDVGSGYHNEFTCIPDKVHFRPQQIHKRPEMKGPQSAVVVGPAGEEIYTDEYGRVKVQFFWDREGQNNENSSCFLRVMQVWAGNKWGASFIPRIGHEVIVSFLDGDPDRPIVAGCVYNQKNKPPYSEKTQSGIKSRSSKGASASNFNEMRFEDKKGAEQLYIQAEKNQDNLVKNDETTNVGNNRTETVGTDETITIGSNRTENVGSNETITIGANRIEKVGVDESIAVGSNQTINIGANRTKNIGANESIAVASNRTENVGANEKVSIGGNQIESVGGNKAETVTIAKALSIGAAYQVSVGAAKNETVGLSSTEQVGIMKHILAGKRFELVVGDSSLVLNSDGTIILKGKEILIESGAQTTVKGKVVEIN